MVGYVPNTTESVLRCSYSMDSTSDSTGNASVGPIWIDSSTANTMSNLTLGSTAPGGTWLTDNTYTTDLTWTTGDGIILNPVIIGGCGHSLTMTDGAENKAQTLLSRVIGFAAFRGYLRKGFVSYRGKSGKIYQIFPGYGETQVWQNGQPVERLCLIFKNSSLPPTDSVIMRLLMLENDEEGFRKLANVHAFNPNRERYTDPVAERGRILRMAADKKAGVLLPKAIWLHPSGQLTIRADTVQQFTIRVA